MFVSNCACTRKTERDETSKYQLIADQTAKGFVISDRDWNMHVCAVTQLVEASYKVVQI